ncbi:MAG: n-acetylglutamate synthase [Bacillota bacterium]
MIDLNGKRFCSTENSDNGQVSKDTIFQYYQNGNIIWATYGGGEIVFGTVLGKVEGENCLDIRYQHLNRAGRFMTGECKSEIVMEQDGKLAIYESWRWTCGDFSEGKSVIREI